MINEFILFCFDVEMFVIFEINIAILQFDLHKNVNQNFRPIKGYKNNENMVFFRCYFYLSIEINTAQKLPITTPNFTIVSLFSNCDAIDEEIVIKIQLFSKKKSV